MNYFTIYFISRCRAIFYGNTVNKPLLLFIIYLLLLLEECLQEETEHTKTSEKCENWTGTYM